ncbi:MAG: hypothetical protein ACOVJ5_01060 [Gloeomargaritales cyanobacterium]
MTRINELTEADRIEFFNEIVKQHGLNHAISCVTENDRLSSGAVFCMTDKEKYWSELYWNGYPKVEMTLKEIEEKLDLAPNTLKVIPY